MASTVIENLYNLAAAIDGVLLWFIVLTGAGLFVDNLSLPQRTTGKLERHNRDFKVGHSKPLRVSLEERDARARLLANYEAKPGRFKETISSLGVRAWAAVKVLAVILGTLTGLINLAIYLRWLPPQL